MNDPAQSLVGSLCESSMALPIPERRARTAAAVLAAIDARGAGMEKRRSEERPAPTPPSKGQVPSVMVATLPSSNDAIQKAVAAVPLLVSEGEAGEAPFPALTVEQYVSLRAALLVSPGEWDEVLRRYGVPSTTSFQALCAHWQEEIAAKPEVRAKMGAVIAAAVGWLWGKTR